MDRLLPDPGPTDVDSEMAEYRPFDHPHDERPWVAVNMVTTLDGRASLSGRSKDIGSKVDTELLLKLRTRFDAVMIGAGTMRAERYGRIVPDAEARARRERIGLPQDPLAVIVSGRLDLPFDAPLFTGGGGQVLVFTNDDSEIPETATPVRVERREGRILMSDVLGHLRKERGVRALLCEGGPHVFGQLAEEDCFDDLFLTVSPMLTGEHGAPRILEGSLQRPEQLSLVRLSQDEGELFARYRRLGVA
jgi:riboflavin biosynthesis pyrimidine reductase